jgi:uncharacterized protein (TIGR03000 family)
MLPVTLLQSSLEIKSPIADQRPDQLPDPEQIAVATQPPIPPDDPGLDAKTRTAPRIREPEERFVRPEGELGYPDSMFGKGHWHWSGWRYGPRVAPTFEYPGLGGGPKVIYPWGEPGYSGRNGPASLDKCCRLWGPPVPVYTPIPEHETKNLIYPGRNVSSPGFVYGWVGPFPASPRPKHPTVNSWAQPGADLSTGHPGNDEKTKNPSNPGGGDAKKSVGFMTLSVKVPDPSAELLVNGVTTSQTGTERTFSSPELESGKEFQYEVTVRWLERGAINVQKKLVVGSSGDVIPLDFTVPEVLRAER